jgi:hypothetical protein
MRAATRARSLQFYLQVTGPRPKTLRAVARVSEAMSEKQLRRLPKTLLIFAPSLFVRGEVVTVKRGGPVVYLSPQLEHKSQALVNRTVAHELAHVVRGHYGKTKPSMENPPANYKDLPWEIEARNLSAKWLRR